MTALFSYELRLEAVGQDSSDLPGIFGRVVGERKRDSLIHSIPSPEIAAGKDETEILVNLDLIDQVGLPADVFVVSQKPCGFHCRTKGVSILRGVTDVHTLDSGFIPWSGFEAGICFSQPGSARSTPAYPGVIVAVGDTRSSAVRSKAEHDNRLSIDGAGF